jgi:hypothetical protein
MNNHANGNVIIYNVLMFLPENFTISFLTDFKKLVFGVFVKIMSGYKIKPHSNIKNKDTPIFRILQ